ncbi:TMV resistance protein N-like [Carya illinoinensis]|uniref:TMV resistance protein N-like n=1 Tax=Carya illinoinensis TaxID=32201 RepID=UPI001C729287|nr:TMV resistance protein N-like [Carya illinoinensis]
MNFGGCDFLTKFLDISSCPNLKKIDLRSCKNLVEIHDSVGLILDKLVNLRLGRCFNLKSFLRRLQLRSLELLSSLLNFPKIECEMEHLQEVYLMGTAIEELPSSIGFLTRLSSLYLSGSVNLKRLPSSIHQLRFLQFFDLSNCPNIRSFGMEEEVHNGQPTPYVVSTSWKNEASLGAELSLLPPTKSTTSLILNLMNSGLSKSNFFGPFHFFPNLDHLDLSGSDIVSIPTSIKRYVRLGYLILNDCKQLQEIKEFPPNLNFVHAGGCISLESLPEISKEFNFPRLRWIDLASCYKVNMGNWISNPAWNGAEMIFPRNKILEWFSHCKEITSNSHRCEFDIKVALPYNLDDIIGIAFCVVIEFVAAIFFYVDIRRALGENVIEPVTVTYPNRYWQGHPKFDEIDSDHVWLRYLTTENITRLRNVSADQANDHLRIIFENCIPDNSLIFKRCEFICYTNSMMNRMKKIMKMLMSIWMHPLKILEI